MQAQRIGNADTGNIVRSDDYGNVQVDWNERDAITWHRVVDVNDHGVTFVGPQIE